VAGQKKGSVFAVGIDYSGTSHPLLPYASQDARSLEGFFAEWGFTPLDECARIAAYSARDIIDRLERWVDSQRTGDLGSKIVFYLAGHGRLHNGRHYMLAAGSPVKPPYFGSKAISAEDVVQAILNSGASSGLILLDACYSASAAHEVQQALDRAAAAHGVPGMDLAVLVPSLHHERSYSGLFVSGLLAALHEGSGGGFWKDGDEYVTLLELRDELRLRLGDEQCAHVAGRDGLKIFPNPKFRAGAAERAVEVGELLAQPPAEEREHFFRKAAGADAGDIGWYFSGRTEMSRRAVRWRAEHDEGMLGVTGAPGTGKSAFLGRLAVLADDASRAACRTLGLFDCPLDTQPTRGVFDAVLHLRNRRIGDAARDLAAQLGLELSASTSPARDLINHLIDSKASVTVLADALDESEYGDETLIARDVLRAVAGLPGCRVIVGTRRDQDAGVTTEPDDPGPLIATLEPANASFDVLDLSEDADAEPDIEHYVVDRLSRSDLVMGWPTPAARQTIARAIARQAEGVFLYARFALRAVASLDETVLDEADWNARLPAVAGQAGLHEVFADDLGRFPDPVLIQDVLRPLAFARGKGLPRRQIWPELAGALAAGGPSGRAYTAADISRVIREAAWYLVEGTEDGQAVFRLYHRSIGDYLRSAMSHGE